MTPERGSISRKAIDLPRPDSPLAPPLVLLFHLAEISPTNLRNAGTIINKACRRVPFPGLIRLDVIAIDAAQKGRSERIDEAV